METTVHAHCTCSFCLWEYHPTGVYNDESVTLQDLVAFWQEVHNLERDGCKWPIAWSLGND